MRREYRLATAVALGSLLVGGGALGAENFLAFLSGAEEVPANASPATGTGTFVLSDDETSLSYTIEYSGLTATETGAHIHNAPAGTNGSVVHTLPATNPKVGAWAISPAMVLELRAGNLYANIHTTNFPGGEIRGQLIAEAVPNDGQTWGGIKSLYR